MLHLVSRSVLSFSLFSTLAGIVAGCDSPPPPRRGPCDRDDAPVGCGVACGVDADCASGLYCDDDGLCNADCSTAVRCTGTLVCGPNGRCIGASVDAGVIVHTDAPRPDTGPPPDAPPLDGACAAVNIETTRATPNVIVIVDRSGSMGTEEFPAGSGVSRWNALRNALIDPATGLLYGLDSSVRFGFVTYRNLSAMGGSCPQISVFPARLDNAAEIASVYSTMMPYGPTPTGDSITATLGRLDELVSAVDEPTIFVLATDGEPNTCESSTDEVGGRAESVAAVADAYLDFAIRTYVISVGADVSTAHLQDVANAGVGHVPGMPDAPFYVATDVSGLRDALTSIIGTVASCDITLEGEIDPTLACSGSVTLGGRELPCDDPNGWEAVDSTHIRLLGTACSELQTTGAAVRGLFPCEVVVF